MNYIYLIPIIFFAVIIFICIFSDKTEVKIVMKSVPFTLDRKYNNSRMIKEYVWRKNKFNGKKRERNNFKLNNKIEDKLKQINKVHFVSVSMKPFFDSLPAKIYSEEEVGVLANKIKNIRADKICYIDCDDLGLLKKYIPKNKHNTFEDLYNSFDLIHVDGNYENCAIDNLELVVFVDKFVENDYSEENKVLNKTVKELSDSNKVLRMKNDNISKSIEYYKKQNDILQKDIRKAEAEANKAWKIIETRGIM